MAPFAGAEPQGVKDRRQEAIRRILERRYRDVQSSLAALMSAGQADTEVLGDIEADDGVLHLVNDAQWRTLTQIGRALDKLDEGTFGVCEECGQPIGEARLRALPFADLCIQCKQTEERAGGSPAGTASQDGRGRSGP